MKRILALAAPLFGLAVMLPIRCSMVSGPLAGGSGLGNPPTNLSFAMVADTGIGSTLSKKTASASSSNTSPDATTADRKLGIKDQRGLSYAVSSATITIDYLRFLVAVPDSLPYFTLGKGFSHDAAGIIVTGPFVFDIINNTVMPPLDRLTLPATAYTGVEMLFGKNDSSREIEIAGTFTYANAVHGFMLALSCDKLGRYMKQGDFLLEDRQITSVNLRMNASTWLDSVDLGTCLDKGWVEFDSSGVLAVDDKMPQGCNKYNKVIQDNIVSSGRLETKK